jgi:hypothetical protein
LDYELAYGRLTDPKRFNSAREAKDVANEFEDSLLGIEHAPDEHVDFVCRVLSEASMAKRPGLEHLVLALYADREKLSETQLRRFVDCVANSFSLVTDKNLAFASCDFIARVLPPSDALLLIRELTAKSTSQAALAGVFVGLDILRRQARASEAMRLDAVELAIAAAEERRRSLK